MSAWVKVLKYTGVKSSYWILFGLSIPLVIALFNSHGLDRLALIPPIFFLWIIPLMCWISLIVIDMKWNKVIRDIKKNRKRDKI